MNNCVTNTMLILLFIILYGWSSKILSTNNNSNGVSMYNSELLGHVETVESNWVLDSSVCKLGKISFLLWSFILIVSIVFPVNIYMLIMCYILTLVAMYSLNLPFFIRSIPAFLVLGYILANRVKTIYA